MASRKNFPSMVKLRREGALERLKAQKPRDEEHAKFIKKAITILEAKIKSSAA
jgi:hypothetical protein